MINSDDRVAGPFTSGNVYPFEFKVFDEEEIVFVEKSADGIETTKVLTTDYTVVLNPDQDIAPGGEATRVAGNISGGITVTLSSNVQPLQGVQIANLGGFFPAVLNNALDKLTILVQQLYNLVNRSIKFPLSDSPSIITELPTATIRANRTLVFGSDGGVAVSADNYVDQAAEAAASAALAQAAAAQTTIDAANADASADRAEAAASQMEQVNNFGAITNPTVNDDAGDEYGVGSRWVNNVTNALFTCVDNTVGAAIWVRIYEFGAVNGCIVFLKDVSSFVGDGVADDGPAINTAVAALSTTGGTIIFPKAKIGINTVVNDNGKTIWFQGQGTHVDENKAATVIKPLSDVDLFRITGNHYRMSDMYIGNAGLVGTTPLGYAGTKNSMAVTIGYGGVGGQYALMQRINFRHIPGRALHWREGSHFRTEQVVCYQCHNGGLYRDPLGYDANHGNFDLHVTFCRGYSVYLSGAYHILNEIKTFANEWAPQLPGSSMYGSLFVEQHALANNNLALVNGATTLTNVNAYWLISARLFANIIGTGFSAGTYITAIDLDARTVSFNKPMTLTGTQMIAAVAPKQDLKASVLVGKNCDGVNIIGDDIDPKYVYTSSDYGGWVQQTNQDDVGMTKELRGAGLRIRQAFNAGAKSPVYDRRRRFNATFTSGSAVVTAVDADVFKSIRVGDGFSSERLAANTTITAVDPAAGTVTLAANAASSGTGTVSAFPSLTGGGMRIVSTDANQIDILSDFTINSVDFWVGGVASIYRGTLTSGSNVVTNLIKVDGNETSPTIATGYAIISEFFANGTTVTSVANLATGSVTMSANASSTQTSVTLYFFRPLGKMLFGFRDGLGVLANEAAAVSAGLKKGQLYQTSTGEVRIKL